MEGVIDALMRDMLTRQGGYERCVTEFVRVSQTVLPSRVFYRLCPELRDSGHTPAGTPVYVQLLGSDPYLMGRNAQVAAKLGAPGIDLNFGCPAKTVNKSEGGAALLRKPNVIADVCRAVRDAVPAHIPVTAKMRLGYEDDSDFDRIVDGIVDAGIDELVVHARTKVQGYRPPAHWARISDVSKRIPIPVIANGELWSPADVALCLKHSQCSAVMLARGALCRPDLGAATQAAFNGTPDSDPHEALTWQDVLPMLVQFMEANAALYDEKYSVNPVKQWLVYLKHYYPQAAALFALVKRINKPGDMLLALNGEPVNLAA